MAALSANGYVVSCLIKQDNNNKKVLYKGFCILVDSFGTKGIVSSNASMPRPGIRAYY